MKTFVKKKKKFPTLVEKNWGQTYTNILYFISFQAVAKLGVGEVGELPTLGKFGEIFGRKGERGKWEGEGEGKQEERGNRGEEKREHLEVKK